MIKSIRLQNFFSFRDTTIELNPDVNILVGINGSGKTNFIKAIELLRELVNGNNTKDLISSWGGFDAIANGNSNTNLYDGINITYNFALFETSYTITLKRSLSDNYTLAENIKINYGDSRSVTASASEGNGISYKINEKEINIEKGLLSTLLDARPDAHKSVLFTGFDWQRDESSRILLIKKKIEVYEVFNTSKMAPLRRPAFASAEQRLSKDAGNLVLVLNYLKGESLMKYNNIAVKLQEINPQFLSLDYTFFGGNVELAIHEKNLNRPIKIAHISDGTLRYICFQAIFNNPNRGKVVCIDEPETGLHPDMIRGIAKSIQESGETSQMIISTHSENLLNQFRLENILVFEKDETNATVVNSFTEEQFSGWYETFFPGKMWVSGDIGGNRW